MEIGSKDDQHLWQSAYMHELAHVIQHCAAGKADPSVDVDKNGAPLDADHADWHSSGIYAGIDAAAIAVQEALQ
jgi:hypothetical protein